MISRSKPKIVSDLLTRPESKFGPKEPDRSVSAIKARLLSQREKPIQLLQKVMEDREKGAFAVGKVDSSGQGVIEASGGGEMSEAEFNSRLQRMMGEAPGKISITSGKRDSKKQQQLWANALKKYGDPEIADNWVARPGTSKHESGLAADLKFADDATKAWFHQNSKKYGLYFPMGNEPWHIQFNKKNQPPVGGAPPVGGGGGGGIIEKAPGRFYTGNPLVDFIIDGESNGIPTAQNPTSSAFGIGQMIKANREAYGKRLGFNPNTTDPSQQIAMMMEYIKDRYKTPEAAAAFKKKHGWY